MTESNEFFKASLPIQGRLCTESLDKRKERQKKNAQAMAASRSAETPENTKERTEKDALTKAASRRAESPEKTK